MSLFEKAMESQDPRPLDAVLELRQRNKEQDEEFGDYVETLLARRE